MAHIEHRPPFRRTVGVLAAAVLWLAMQFSSAARAAPLNFPRATFEVLNAAQTEVIGRSDFALSQRSDGLLIGHGEAHFKDGESDTEYDTLRPVPGSQSAEMLTLERWFYNADGSPQRHSTADFRTGQAACTEYVKGKADTKSATLKFPAGSYAGSAIILPLQEYLAGGGTGPIELHAFNCVPGPRVFAVKAEPKPPGAWLRYPGQTVEVDIKPDFGFLNFIVAPFLPELHAWFEPSKDWLFVGGQFSRYYKGQQIVLVRERTSAHADAQMPSPVAQK
ncbi:MAG TPA: hypothetical protein VJN94_13925 [Candidatus Binataceae bacterium]|nr:hypothetical protein [Candidatus Binataceae bacterium]